MEQPERIDVVTIPMYNLAPDKVQQYIQILFENQNVQMTLNGGEDTLVCYLPRKLSDPFEMLTLDAPGQKEKRELKKKCRRGTNHQLGAGAQPQAVHSRS
ncbi:hypothetical protein MKZ38_001749 [Zalerion maritima]|uniref:Uncharacterized protein n=1 Tax=Zalerion maritima TaxID=339359 RepID=A0AAD5WVH1_9PEZI|nr:hypothetical protein MKZ38_001749 [Zalerion maritima]